MKKIIALMVILALSLAGCAFLQKAQDQMCNPPAAVVAVAKAALPVIGTIIGMLVPGSAAYMAAIASEGTVTAILSGACISLTQLNNLIAFLQGPEVKTLALAPSMKGTAVIIDPQPLIDWRDKAGK